MLGDAAVVLAGLVLLVVGSDRTVDAAAVVARTLGLSTLFVGGTLVAIGSSLPEIATSVYAAVYGAGGFVVGHIVGSATAQITLGIGVVALLAPLSVDRDEVRTYGVGMLVAMALMLVAVGSGGVSHVEGLLLVGAYLLFLRTRYDDEEYAATLDDAEAAESLARPLAVAVGSLALVVLGGHLLVVGARSLARSVGVSQHFLGVLTGLGTTSPEIGLAALAVHRDRSDIAVGTLFGSNITDPLFSLGLGAAVGGVAVSRPRTAVVATAYMLVASALVVASCYRWRTLQRPHAFGCLLLYVPALVAV